MSEREHVVLDLPRGETDMLRVTRREYEGRPFTDVRVFFRGDDGQLRPTKKGCSVRDSEIRDVIAALNKIAAKVRQTPGEQRDRCAPARRGPTPERSGAPDPLTDAELEEVEAAF